MMQQSLNQKTHNIKQQLDTAFADPVTEDDKNQLQLLFRQHLNIELNDVYFGAAEKMIQGGAIDFSACPGSYISVILGACLLSQKGFSSQLVYVTDELASYRANTFKPLFDAMSSEVEVVLPDMDVVTKLQAYKATITFCSVRELGLDFLRLQKESANEFSESLPDNQSNKRSPAKQATQNSSLLKDQPLHVKIDALRKVTLIEDIALVMVDSMMTPLQIADEQTEEVIAISSFNKLFKELPKIGGASPFLDKHTEKDLLRYGIEQHSLRPFQQVCENHARFYNNDKACLQGLISEIQHIASIAEKKEKATVCLIDQLSNERAEALQQQLQEQASQEAVANITFTQLALSDVLPFFQSNERLPQQGIMYVYLEDSISGIIDVSEQYHRIQGVDIALLSMGCEQSFRMQQRRSALFAGVFNCSQSKSFLTVQHFASRESNTIPKILKCFPESVNQCCLPTVLRWQQKYTDYKRRAGNKALLIYEQETDDLLAFSG